ncbi:hypothetical protein HAX54_023989 [Datura stramonium]|uniref:Uncharacterized protein n=1 Tax=Datura stramonium TaxID=4076 RepID=A0ABS8UXG7_DATST|nr:hypothetical protein [Datura stramonium]
MDRSQQIFLFDDISINETLAENNAWDDSWRDQMYGIFELQLKIGGRPTTTEEMAELEKRYSLTKSAMMMYKVEPAFEEPLDDDEPTVMTDVIDNDEEEEDDATIDSLQVDNVDGQDDDDEPECNPNDDDFS